MSRLPALGAELIEQAYGLHGPPRLRNCPLRPSPRQEAFLLLPVFEAFFGGAAGGGKSVALLMDALQYSDVPGYAALLLRPTLAELQLAGGLIELSHAWLAGGRASWSAENRTWRFPGSGRLRNSRAEDPPGTIRIELRTGPGRDGRDASAPSAHFLEGRSR